MGALLNTFLISGIPAPVAVDSFAFLWVPPGTRRACPSKWAIWDPTPRWPEVFFVRAQAIPEAASEESQPGARRLDLLTARICVLVMLVEH